MPQTLISKINGVEIVTVDREGEIFVPIKPICEAIGIDVESQRDKIQADEILSSTAVFSTAVAADGKEREMYCLPLKYVYGWLFTVNPKNVAPEAREAVSRYRRECYDVLYDHFAGAAKRQHEQNRAEQGLLDRKAAALDSIANHKKAIAEGNAEIKKVDEQLSRLQSERLNPQPTLFS